MVHGIQTKDLCGVKLDTGKSEMFAEQSWRVVTQSGLLRRAGSGAAGECDRSYDGSGDDRSGNNPRYCCCL